MANEKKVYEIVAEPRTITGKASRTLRRENLIPAVVYGPKMDTENLQVPTRDFDVVYLRAGSNNLVDLKIGEKGKAHKVFIHEVQRNPLNHAVTHVDFVAVNLREEMTINVPLVLVGESPIVENHEALLLFAVEHVTVRALPMNVPSLIEVDISGLTEIDQTIRVGDLEIPDNVTLVTHVEDPVVKITAMRVVEEEEVAAEEAAEAEAAEGEEGAETAEGDETSASEDES
jgi:large subunit ribosomal protein L25